MAIFLAKMVDGFGLFVTTLWGLQERRFHAILDTVSSAASALTMAFALCFLSINHVYRHGPIPVPLIYIPLLAIVQFSTIHTG